MPRNVIIGMAVAVCCLYASLQIAALREFTGKRRLTGTKYLFVAAAVVMFFVHLLWGSVGPAAIELYVVVATMPVAIVHLAILFIRERRQRAKVAEG